MNPEPVTDEQYQAPHELERFLFADDLFLLNEVKRSLDRALCIQHTPQAVDDSALTAATGRRIVRYPDPTAMVTQIANTGGATATVYEDGVAVLVLLSGEIKSMPMRGTGLIEVDSGLSSTSIRLTLSTRGTCGDPPSSAAPDADPIGSFLL